MFYLIPLFLAVRKIVRAESLSNLMRTDNTIPSEFDNIAINFENRLVKSLTFLIVLHKAPGI
jgi:hypothetical protein